MTMPRLKPLSDALAAPAAGDAVMAQAEALRAAFGSPLFVLSEAALRESYRAFARGFAEAGLRPRIAYSYKTNYLPALCAILHQEGAEAEVVSGMEYSFARALGVPPSGIVFNGPGKTRAELETALADGTLVVIDGFDELEAAREIAASMPDGRALRIGLRLDLGETDLPWSRFGFRRADGAARRALERIKAAPRLTLELLHHHAGTDHDDPAPYFRAARALCEIGREARSLGLAPRALDLGGGFPANRPVAPFAAAIAQGLDAGPALAPGIVVEPGRALADGAMWLVCTVVATKEMETRAAVVDAGINVLPPACRRAPRPVRALGRAPGATGPTAVFGPLCMPEDRLAECADLPPLSPGDVLVIGESGAYTLTQATQFAAPRPAVVLLGPEGPEIVRRREDWRDVLAGCTVPERLRAPSPQGQGA